MVLMKQPTLKQAIQMYLIFLKEYLGKMDLGINLKHLKDN